MPILEEFTCVTEVQVELTEFKVDDNNGDNMLYIELYNTGNQILFDGKTIELIFGENENSTLHGGLVGVPGTIWRENTFLILYSENTMPNMVCYDCDCSVAYKKRREKIGV